MVASFSFARSSGGNGTLSGMHTTTRSGVPGGDPCCVSSTANRCLPSCFDHRRRSFRKTFSNGGGGCGPITVIGRKFGGAVRHSSGVSIGTQCAFPFNLLCRNCISVGVGAAGDHDFLPRRTGNIL